MAAKSWTYTLEDQRLDCSDAFQRARAYHSQLREICQYYMPHRLPTYERAGENGQVNEGDKRTDVLFDATGPAAAASFAANMQADWMPAFDQFFKLESGPNWPAPPEQISERNRGLQAVTDLAHALMPRIRLNANEMFYDLFAGTGAMFIDAGNKKRQPVTASAVPMFEMAMDVGPDGQHDRWFWKRRYRNRHIEQMWDGDVTIGDTLARKIAADRNAFSDVVQYTYWNPRAELFDFVAWVDGEKIPLKKNQFRSTPWVTPRLFVSPGSTFGWGFGHIGLPFVKTVNKARELALRAAAFALLGIWMRRHDGVFNPDTAVMSPGAMWKVADTGGTRGASIARLPIPQNFDVSTIVINDEREQIRRVSLDDELPELTDRVRSPTEIAGRMRRYDRNRGGATVRLAYELVSPMARRVVDIIEGHGLLPTKLEIDDILTMATVTSPAAASQKSGKVDRTVAWMQMTIGLFGPRALAMAAEIEGLIPELGRWLGVEEKWLRSNVDKKALQQAVAQMIAQMQASEQQQSQADAAPQPTPSAEAAYVNDGGY